MPNSGGFPIQLRKVAIANGSQNSIFSGYAGEHAFQVRGYLYNGFFNANLLQVAEGNIRLGGSYGTVTNSFNAYKHGKSHYVNSTINNSISLDFSPSGTYEMFGEIVGQTPQGNTIIKPKILGVPLAYLLGFAARTEADAYKAKGCFIPTKSALAYKGTNPNWGEALNNRSLVCSGETWFDAYYAPNGANEDHIKLNAGNVAWIMNELVNGTPNQNLPTTLSTYPYNASIVDRKSVV